MDMSGYLNEFVSEAKDHLDELNNAILDLEKEPENKDIINRMFRSSHTLKGNGAAMGFLKFAELAHSIEDVMSKIRDGKIAADSGIINIILQGCDIMEKSLENIALGKEDTTESENLIEEFKNITNIKPEKSTAQNVCAKTILTEIEKKEIDDETAKGNNVFRIVLVFEKNNNLKSAKASVLLRELRKNGKIIKTTPDAEKISKGEIGLELEIIVCTNMQKESLISAIDKVSGISSIFVLSLDEEYVKSTQQKNEEKEAAKAQIINEHKNYAVGKVQNIKVSMEKLDKLMNLVGELLISNIRLQDIAHKKDYDRLKLVLNDVDRLVLDLQSDIMEVRMVPIGSIFNRFPRMVRDIANHEKKNVNLIIEGEDIEFDRTVLDKIGDPLVHLLRNSVDHGIELPDIRLKKGKPEEGIIKLIAKREKSKAIIEVSDDGDGIDPKAVAETCIRKGTLTKEQVEKMSDKELQMQIFVPGTTTSKVITELSGRGVGMDTVKSMITSLRGTVRLSSTVGIGTSVTIELPLTVAIVTALLVEVGGDLYAIPLSNVDQTVDIKSEDIKTGIGHDVFLLRGKVIPLFWLDELLRYGNKKVSKKVTVIIVNKEGEECGFAVDSIFSKQQVLIKSFSDTLKSVTSFSGATILGDGKVALILDVNSLI
ncbi:MAG: chemotaxis protein CheA [archaeon]